MADLAPDARGPGRSGVGTERRDVGASRPGEPGPQEEGKRGLRKWRSAHRKETAPGSRGSAPRPFRAPSHSRAKLRRTELHPAGPALAPAQPRRRPSLLLSGGAVGRSRPGWFVAARSRAATPATRHQSRVVNSTFRKWISPPSDWRPIGPRIGSSPQASFSCLPLTQTVTWSPSSRIR